jgi:hypothetical protein
MITWLKMAPFPVFTFTSALLACSSPASAASLFIYNVPATEGGCVNGTSSPPGDVTFDFSGFYDSFVGGVPATSPVLAPQGTETQFSLFWHTTSPGVNTPEETIYFTEPGGLIADVLNYVSSVTGGAGSDFMNIFGYVLPLSTLMTVAQLASEGIMPTGSVSLPTLYAFSATDLTGTFQPAPIPELPAWELMGLGFASLGVAGARAVAKRAAAAG